VLEIVAIAMVDPTNIELMIWQSMGIVRLGVKFSLIFEKIYTLMFLHDAIKDDSPINTP